MRKLWLTLCVIASPVLALDNPGWDDSQSPLLANARGLEKEAVKHTALTRELLNISDIGEQLVEAAQMVDVAISAVQQIGGIIQDMRVVSIKANVDTIGLCDREYIHAEFTGYLDTIKRIMENTTFEDRFILYGGPDYVYNVINKLKNGTPIPMCTLTISSLDGIVASLSECNLLTFATASLAVPILQSVTDQHAMKIQMLNNSKKTILELLKDNSRKHERALARQLQQIAVLKDYMDTALKLAPTQEK
jgi:flagellin-like hook-associated protein FlgL